MTDVQDRFTGSTVQTLDDKQRIAMPAKFVSVLLERVRRELERIDPSLSVPDSPTVVVSLSVNGRIGVYTRPVYEQTLQNILDRAYPRLNGPNGIDPDVLVADFENHRDEVKLDKQNRFRVQPLLLKAMGFDKEVAVVGSGEYIELLPMEECVANVSSLLRDLQRRRLQPPAKEGAGE